MTRPHRHVAQFILLLFTCLTLTACTMSNKLIGNPEAPYPPTQQPELNAIDHLPTGTRVTREQMLTSATDARIVFVGETHDNPASHRLELDLLTAMAERYPGQVSLGLEMFNPEQQETLDAWVAGELDEKTFLKTVDWYSVWKMDFAYYREIMVYARDNRIPVIGLNAPKSLVREIGMKSIDELDEKTRDQLPEMDLDDPYQTAMVEAIYKEHTSGKSMVEGFHRVQTLWDEAMAESVVRHLNDKGEKQRMVVMAGGNHIRYGFGIPRRVYRRLPLSYTLVGNREIVIPEEKKSKVMNVDLPKFPMAPYDYLVYTEYESLPGKKVKLGIRMTDKEGRVVVEDVVAGSTADQAGILADDVIIRFDGIPIEDNFDLIYEVGQRAEGDQVTLVVERGGEEVELEATFVPLPKMDHHGKK